MSNMSSTGGSGCSSAASSGSDAVTASAALSGQPLPGGGPVISVVVPCHNEEGNVPRLVAMLSEELERLKLSFEIVLTDDCSSDNSWAIMKELAAKDSRLRAQRFERNGGQSAALWAGLKAARGLCVITLDADLQNSPRDLPRFVEALKRADCVCGSRVEARAKGDSFLRVISSRIANSTRNRLTHETVSDSGCCYRAFKRECIQNLMFFKGMHRWLPTLIRMEGYSVTEIPISHHPRVAGKSHYGMWNRVFVGIEDLMAVRWMRKRRVAYRVAETLNFEKDLR
jgi:glycosyltransferase involved in cell wall biosynthesis